MADYMRFSVFSFRPDLAQKVLGRGRVFCLVLKENYRPKKNKSTKKPKINQKKKPKKNAIFVFLRIFLLFPKKNLDLNKEKEKTVDLPSFASSHPRRGVGNPNATVFTAH